MNEDLSKLLGGGISLDVACGDRKMDGYIGIDKEAIPGVDIVHDIETFPWPLDDNSCDRVVLSYVLQRIPNTIGVMTEVHRICKHGATVMIAVPYWQSMAAWENPANVRCFNEITFNYFDDRSDIWKQFKPPIFRVADISYSYLGNMEVILTAIKELDPEEEPSGETKVR
jgi:ubiquinone/menaquinone biosynthesis C-methylase UbiE